MRQSRLGQFAITKINNMIDGDLGEMTDEKFFDFVHQNPLVLCLNL